MRFQKIIENHIFHDVSQYSKHRLHSLMWPVTLTLRKLFVLKRSEHNVRYNVNNVQ